MRKLIFAFAFSAMMLPDYGFTLGLGEIDVYSSLNQELNAEIELLSAAPEETEALIVKLASREEFSRAGLDRPYMLSSLKFGTVIRDGKSFIKITSSKPVREPFLNFLIDVDWPRGHMMREYTILLDPPVFLGEEAAPARPAAQDSSRPGASMSAPVAAPVAEPQSSASFRPAMSTPAATPQQPSQPQQAQPVQQSTTTIAPVPVYTQMPYQPPGGYRIQQGDTLWSLADSMRPDQSVSIEQMMLAILRTNPESFINENVNGLKRGYILRIPDRDEIVSMDPAEAVAMVRQQNALWREYQQAVTGGEPASAIDTVGDDRGEATDDRDHAYLEIVAAGSGTSAAGTKDPSTMTESELRAELALARESLESKSVENEALQERVSTLEGELDNMQSLLTLQDSDLADMQKAATPTEAETMPAEAVVTEEITVTEEIVVEETITEEGITEEITVTEEVVVEETVTEEVAEEAQVFVDEQPAEVAAEEPTQPTTSSEDFEVSPTAQPAFMQEQRGPLAALMKNPMMLAAAGGGLLLILLLLALIMKRRKGSAQAEPAVASNLEDVSDMVEERDLEREVSDEEVKEEMAAAEAEAEAEEATEEALETDSTVVLPSEGEAEDTAIAQAEEQPEAEEPRDDVIAEADVYLAYGIYQQAEDLLQNAIKENPDNDAYRVKLAETYFAGKNADAFASLATEMHQRGCADTPAWNRMVAIGKELCPEHDLFKGAAAEMVDNLEMDDLVTQSPEPMDIDLGGEAEEAVPELDLGIDESAEAEAEEALEELEAEGEEPAGVEFDLSEAEAVEPSGEVEEEFSLDIEASELDIEEEPESVVAAGDVDFDLDLTEDAEELLATDSEETDEGMSLDDVDAGSLEFDAGAEAGLEEETEISTDELGIDEDSTVVLDLEEESAEPEMDATAILDEPLPLEEPALEEPAAEEPVVEESVIEETAMEEPAVEEPAMEEPVVEEPVAEMPAAGADELDDSLDLSDLDDVDEVSTKLDLAKAYLDMGDADGTRSILDEVLAEGNDEQKQEAQELLNQLG